MKNKVITVEADGAGERLDLFLYKFLPLESRSMATKLIQTDRVILSNQPNKKLKASMKVEEGQEFKVELPDAKPTNLIPYDFPLQILFEDEHLIVVNKPAGLVVHPAAGHEQDTLVNALIHHCSDFHIGLDDIRPGIVHRLDKDTSGVMVVAKTNQSMEVLSSYFKNRNIKRFYWAICMGSPKFEHKLFESEIGRHPVDRKKMSSKGKQGKNAITEAWNLQSYLKKLSLIKFKLHTGRTHQIRVHSSENHFPILGDPIYSNINALKGLLSPNQLKEIKGLGRLCLHAAVLGFVHPITKEELLFYAPVPEEMQELVAKYGFEQSLSKEAFLESI